MMKPERIFTGVVVLVAWCVLLVQGASTTNIYFFPSHFRLKTMMLGSPLGHLEAIRNADSLSGIVRATNDVEVLTNETYATEYEGMAWGYPTATDAWHAALSCYGKHLVNHEGVYYDNAGWIEGTRQADGLWGAYIWYLKNTIAFYSSTSMVYALSNAKTSEIACVVVGSLGVYPPQTHVAEVGPILPTNLPGPGTSKDEVFRADLSTYYRLVSECTWPINHGDSDGDKIPGFADGYNRDGVESPDDLSTDAFQAWKLYLYNACEPTQATVRITYSSSDPAGVIVDGSNYVAAAGAFRLWMKNGNKGRKQNSFVSGDPGDYVPPGEYSAHDLGFSNRADSITLFIEPVNIATNAIILFEVDPDGTNSAKKFVAYAKIVVSVIGAELIPDFNHNREIAADDESLLISDGLFRFWINDDNDAGDESKGTSDTPGQSDGNCKDDKVNGRCDLLDFFPVWIDLHDTLNALMPGGSIHCRLKQADNALRVVYTDLTKDHAGDFLTTEGSTYGPSFEQHSYEADTFEITSSGVDLSPGFLSMIKNDADKGILLMEGASSTISPLILEVWKDGVKLFEKTMPLSIDGVEKMYRWVNLRNMANPGPQPPPDNYPDSLCNSKNFLFIHGYNVDEQSARGWNAEVFKRMYWSGSRAKFHAVTWYGNDSQMNIPLLGSLTPDYHVNVIHAFETAPSLAAYVNGLSGEHIVAAHSLGNMVASAAIQDYGMNAVKYYMVDAAVALEAYDGDPSARSLDMVHADWDGYQDRLYCGNWHTNFPSGDHRRALTWADRFEDAGDHAYNFYSSGEDTLATHAHNDPPGLLDVGIFNEVHEYAWALQEKLKGRMWVSWMGGGSTYGGWGFNSAYNTGVYDPSNDVYLIATTPETAATIPNYILPENPYFKPGSGAIDDLYSTNAATASAFAQSNHVDLLAAFIPALSLPAGANEVAKIGDIGGGNFNMQAAGADPGYQNDWPDVRKNNNSYGTRWLHSDFKNIAFPYVHSLFKKFTDVGGLDAQ